MAIRQNLLGELKVKSEPLEFRVTTLARSPLKGSTECAEFVANQLRAQSSRWRKTGGDNSVRFQPTPIHNMRLRSSLLRLNSSSQRGLCLLSSFLLGALSWSPTAQAGFTLTGTQYTQDFNGIGTGLPTDWTVRTGATATALGTSVSLTTAATAWSDSGGSFKNMATATGATSADSTATQAASINRALGVRQTGSFGDPGASFNFNLTTTGFSLTGLTLNLQMLSVQTRSTVWSVQYGLGTTPSSWTTLTTFSDPAAFGSTPITLTAGELAPLSNQPDAWIRVVALAASSGTGSRDSFGIDDFVLSYTALDPGLFWDANGDVAGAGVTPTGTWGTSDFWSTSPAGTTVPAAWIAGKDATFSAGSDVTGPFTVTVSGNQSVGGITFQEGEPTLTGGILTFSDSSPLVVVESGVTTTLASTVSGANGLSKAGAGILVLTGANDFAGNVTIGAGTLSIATEGPLGQLTNDLIVNGTLKTTASILLDAGRDVSGSGSYDIATGTTLTVPGVFNATNTTLISTGTLNLTGATPAVGGLNFTAAGTLNATGVVSATGLSASALTAGTAVVNPALNFGVATTSLQVGVGSGGRLNLLGAVSRGTSAAGRVTKIGAGTLVLNTANPNLYGVEVGVSGLPSTEGGVLEISNKDALGTLGLTAGSPALGQFRLNAGTLSAAVPLTGANAIAHPVSVAGRDATPSILAGEAMEFTGPLVFFGTGTTPLESVLNVNNQTVWSGSVTTATSTSISGLTLGGTGQMTFTGSLTAAAAPLTVKNTLTVVLGTSAVGAASVPSTNINLEAGAKIKIGVDGTPLLVTAYKGLNGAANSTLHFDVAGTTRGTEYDALVLAKPTATAAGNVTFAGFLDVDFAPSFTPVIGQSFDLLDWDATAVVNFAGLDFSLLPTLPPTMLWNTATFATDGTISIVSSSIQIVTPPASQTVDPGASVTFTVVATAPGTITYQWFKGPILIPDATSSSYTIPMVVEGDEGSYTVVATYDGNAVTSAAAILTVNDPFMPVLITDDPDSLLRDPGTSATFTVVATGTGPLFYQWKKGNININGAESASYTINAVQETDEGNYTVVVTGPGLNNTATSAVASLTVNPVGVVAISGNGVYTQDFNSMGTAGTAPPNGWFAYDTDGTPGVSTLLAGTGSSNAGRVYNFGSTGSTDRALGSVASGSYVGAFGVSLLNDSGSTLEGANIRFAFRSELWRQGATTSQDIWTFEWKLGGNANDSTGWSAASDFNMLEVIVEGAAEGAIDGNATGNFTTLALTNFTNLTGWEDGQTLHIRWRDANESGNDSGMAIDDFQVDISGVIPPPPSAYWDINDTVAGAGGATPSGTWGTNSVWNLDPAGELTTAAWTAGNEAVFSAGSDATGTFAVNVSGTQDLSGLVIEEGTLTLSGGTLNFSDATPVVRVFSGATTAALTVDSTITGTAGLLKQGLGALTLSGVNTFTGNIAVGSGLLQISADSALGNAENDLLLTGTLKTTATLDLAATRGLSGGGSFAPAAGTELGILGPVTMSGLILADTGTLDLRTATATSGPITLSAAGSLQGATLTTGDIIASYAAGSATIENDINFGSIVRSVQITDAASTLTLNGDLSLLGTGNDRLIKIGAGTLVLNGVNTSLIRVAVGIQATTNATPGGTVVISNKDALGNSKVFLNFGTLQATTPLTGANALPIGLSLSGRDAAPAVLSGAAIEFTGVDSELFNLAAGTGDIRLNVNNHTTIGGAISGNTNATISGLAVGGTGKLTFTGAGVLTGFTTALKLKDSVTVELDTAVVSDALAIAASVISLDAGTTLAIGTVGTTSLVTAYNGLTTADTSVVSFDIGGTNRGATTSGYDALDLVAPTGVAAGSPVIAGTVKVSLVDGFAPVLGQQFDLLNWDATATPNFTGIDFDLPALSSPTLAWDTTNFATDGTIRVITSTLLISLQPASQQVNPGASVTFSVSVTGLGPIFYQWFKGTEEIDGAESASYTINSVVEGNEGEYYVVITNPGGPLESARATLTVNDPITAAVVSRAPNTSPLYVGDSVIFSVAVTGSGNLNYQWRKDGEPITNAQSSTYSITSLTAANDGVYDVLVNNGGTPFTSTSVSVTVAPAIPVITQEPVSKLVHLGQPLELSVLASGKPPLKYQWKKNNVKVAGATSATYLVPSSALINAGAYTCEVSNGTGTDFSLIAQVGVVGNIPVTLIQGIGTTALLKLSSAGNGLTYAWSKDGGALPANATVARDFKSVSVKTLTTDNSGTYSCTVTGPVGSQPLTITGATHILKVFDSKPELIKPVVMDRGIISGTYVHDIAFVSEPTNKTPTTFAVTGLPLGLKLDTKTGRISGKPTKAGTFPLKITASNTKGKDETTTSLVVDSFPTGIDGAYVGTVSRSVPINGNLGGRYEMTITNTGAISGFMILGTTRYTLKGAMDIDVNQPGDLTPLELPSATILIPRTGALASMPITFSFDLDVPGNRIAADSAFVTIGSDSASAIGWKNIWKLRTAVATNYVGAYTFGMALPDGDPLLTPVPDVTVPQGSGFGSFKVADDGKLTIAGKTADGETLTMATFVGPLGEVAMFQTFYTPAKGSLLGAPVIDIGLTTTTEDNTFSGPLSWFRPASTLATARLYKAGFGPFNIAASGGRYVAPPLNTRIMGLTAQNATARLIFSSSFVGLPAPGPNITVTITDKNKAVLPLAPNNPRKTTLPVITTTTGAFSGSFTHDDPNPLSATNALVRRTVPYQGLLVKEGNSYVGVGYFLMAKLPEAGPPATTATNSPIRSGHVLFEPVPVAPVAP